VEWRKDAIEMTADNNARGNLEKFIRTDPLLSWPKIECHDSGDLIHMSWTAVCEIKYRDQQLRATSTNFTKNTAISNVCEQVTEQYLKLRKQYEDRLDQFCEAKTREDREKKRESVDRHEKVASLLALQEEGDPDGVKYLLFISYLTSLLCRTQTRCFLASSDSTLPLQQTTAAN
jgi:hypothetical protein